MADASFDVVSKVDRQEVDNALNQAAKEAATRYDFKGTGAEIAWSGESIVLKASSEERCAALLELNVVLCRTNDGIGPAAVPAAGTP